MCDDEIKDDESIYSIIETDEIENIETEYETSDDEPDLIEDLAGLKIEMMNQTDCEHNWIRGKGDYNIKCAFCIYYPSQDNRATCSLCLKQVCVECLKAKNQEWRQEVEIEPEDKILSSRVRILENRVNKLEEELETLQIKVKGKGIIEDKNLENTEYQEQSLTIKDNKNNKRIQLREVLESFGNKYIVKLPFKEIIAIRIPVEIKLKPNVTYKLLALVDTGCTKNIIHNKFFIKCPEIVHTIEDSKADVSTDMSGIKKVHNQLAYNIETYINGTRYIIDETTIRDLSMIDDDMIIGLRFLQQSVQTTIIHEQGITFIPYQDNSLLNIVSHVTGMKKGITNSGMEVFIFGPENKLKIFPPNTYNFKPKSHIVLDEIQECILDNFWFQYNNKREDKGYMLSILNSLAEYFNMMNKKMPSAEAYKAPEQRPLYVLFDGKAPGIYITFEKIIAMKIEARISGGLTWRKYISIDEALLQAKNIIGVNYYIEPEAKEYISKYKRATAKASPPRIMNTKEEASSSSKKTYKECLIKGVDPLDGEYIDWKIEEKFEKISPEWKKDIKEEILTELRKELKEKFENMKKEYDDKYDINNFLDEDKMDTESFEGKIDIGGHGQGE